MTDDELRQQMEGWLTRIMHAAAEAKQGFSAAVRAMGDLKVVLENVDGAYDALIDTQAGAHGDEVSDAGTRAYFDEIPLNGNPFSPETMDAQDWAYGWVWAHGDMLELAILSSVETLSDPPTASELFCLMRLRAMSSDWRHAHPEVFERTALGRVGPKGQVRVEDILGKADEGNEQ